MKSHKRGLHHIMFISIRKTNLQKTCAFFFRITVNRPAAVARNLPPVRSEVDFPTSGELFRVARGEPFLLWVYHHPCGTHPLRLQSRRTARQQGSGRLPADVDADVGRLLSPDRAHWTQLGPLLRFWIWCFPSKVTFDWCLRSTAGLIVARTPLLATDLGDVG